MANVIDFRALGHEFSPDKAHGASFARFTESSSADAMWFYRFDANYVETRDLFSSKDHVFASLSTADIRQQFRSILGSNTFEIKNVQDAFIGESHLLLVVVSVIDPQEDHILVWDPLTLHLQLLLTAPHLVTTITVATDQATTVSHRLVKRWSSINGGTVSGPGECPTSPVSPTWPSTSSPFSPATFAPPHPFPLPLQNPPLGLHKSNEKNDTSSLINPLGGRRSSSISSTTSSQETAAIDEHHHGRDSRSASSAVDVARQSSVLQVNNRRKLLIMGHRNGSVTVYKFKISESGHVSCATITAVAAISAQGPGSFPTIVAATKAGFVAIFNTSGKGGALKVDVDDLGSKKLPIQDITLMTTRDKTMTVLAVCQGFLRGATELHHNEKPCVSIYHLRLNHSDFHTLGYVQPDIEPGMTVHGGKTLVATVSEDRHGLFVHCAFRVDLNNHHQQSTLKTVRISGGETEVVDSTVLRCSEHSGNLLDISPVMHSSELRLLYLNKLESYIPSCRLGSGDTSDSSMRGNKNTKDTTTTTTTTTTTKTLDEVSQRQRWMPETSDWIEDDITATTYTEATRSAIEERRRQMGGKLFFDRLLEFVDLPTERAGTLYPPRTHAQTKNLWVNIYHNGQLELEHRNCLAYYLLKDQTTGDASASFVQQHWISPAFVHLMNGFWALDHFQFKNAVLYLSQPGLTIDWVEEVVRVLLELGSPWLARQLIMSAGLEFRTRSGMTVMMQVLLRSDLEDALNYQRQQRQKALDRLKAKRERVAAALEDSGNVEERGAVDDEEDDDGFVLSAEFYEELFGQLLAYCFEGDSEHYHRDHHQHQHRRDRHHHHHDKKPNKASIQELSRQTLSRYEEQALVRYGESHPAHSTTRTVCWEFLAMYYVKHACFLEAIGIHQQLLEDEEAEETDNKTTSNERQQQRRHEIIRHLKEMLPEPQLKLLEIQEEERRRRRHRGSNKAKEASGGMEVDDEENNQLPSASSSQEQQQQPSKEDSDKDGRRILTNTDGYRTGTMRGLLEGWVELQRDLEKLTQTKTQKKKASNKKENETKEEEEEACDNIAVVPRKPFQSLWEVDADQYLQAWQSNLLTTKENE
ncbi:hypothetical protein DFQ26_004491 [Actinomortierella ambigua]|nr:hypothetical protein DFQ26_004491 [Actinomortierella ambigua]